MNRAITGFIAGIVMLLFSVGADAAADTYVSYRGADTNGCTRVLPCRNVTKALTVTDVNGTVHIIDSGEYRGFVVSVNASIVADPGITANIIGSGGNVVGVTGGDVTLKNLQVFNAFDGNGIAINNANVIVEDSSFFNNDNLFLKASDITIGGTGIVTIRRCYFNGGPNGQNSGVEQNGGKVSVRDSEFNNYFKAITSQSTVLVNHCIFTNNQTAISGSFASTGDNVFFNNVTDIVFNPSAATVH